MKRYALVLGLALLAFAAQLDAGTPPTHFWCATDYECENALPHVPDEDDPWQTPSTQKP